MTISQLFLFCFVFVFSKIKLATGYQSVTDKKLNTLTANYKYTQSERVSLICQLRVYSQLCQLFLNVFLCLLACSNHVIPFIFTRFLIFEAKFLTLTLKTWGEQFYFRVKLRNRKKCEIHYPSYIFYFIMNKS